MGAVGDGPAAAWAGFEAEAEGLEPALGIGAVGGGAEFGAGEVAGCGLKSVGFYRANLGLQLADPIGLGAVTDELAQIAAAVVLDAAGAADAAMVALIGFGPARQAEPVVGQAGHAAVLGRDARGHDMEMAMLAVLVDDHEGLAIGEADAGHGGATGGEHGVMIDIGLVGSLVGRPG